MCVYSISPCVSPHNALQKINQGKVWVCCVCGLGQGLFLANRKRYAQDTKDICKRKLKKKTEKFVSLLNSKANTFRGGERERVEAKPLVTHPGCKENAQKKKKEKYRKPKKPSHKNQPARLPHPPRTSTSTST